MISGIPTSQEGTESQDISASVDSQSTEPTLIPEEKSKLADLFQEIDGDLIIPTDRKFPSQKESYQDELSPNPTQPDRLQALFKDVAVKYPKIFRSGEFKVPENPLGYEGKMNGFVTELQNKGFSPEQIQHSTIDAFSRKIDKLIEDARSTGLLKPEEELGLEVLLRLPQIVLTQIELDSAKVFKTDLEQRIFGTTDPLEIARKMTELNRRNDIPGDIKELARQYNETRRQIRDQKEFLATYNHNYYRFVMLNQDNPELDVLLGDYFLQVGSMSEAPFFTPALSKKFADGVRTSQAGCTAPITAAKALEYIGLPVELPLNVKADLDYGVDLGANLVWDGQLVRLLVQVKSHKGDPTLFGVEIDGPLLNSNESYQRVAQKARFMSQRAQIEFEKRGSPTITRMVTVFVGKLSADHPYTGLEDFDKIPIKGKFSPQAILE